MGFHAVSHFRGCVDCVHIAEFDQEQAPEVVHDLTGKLAGVCAAIEGAVNTVQPVRGVLDLNGIDQFKNQLVGGGAQDALGSF